MFDHLPVSEIEVREYFDKATRRDLVGRLLQEKEGKCVGELLGYAAAIRTSLPHVGHASGFLDYVEQFKALRANVAIRVWTTPAGYHWNAMARMLLDASLYDLAPAGSLKQYLEFLGLDLERGLIAHLNDFGRFLLSALVLARAEVRLDLDVPISLRLPCALPGTGLALLTRRNETRTIRVSSIDQDTIDGLVSPGDGSEDERTVVFRSEDRCEVIARTMPRWRRLKGDILIDAFEPCLNLPYVEIYPRGQAPEQSRHFLRVFERAVGRLSTYDPALVDEICLLTSSVTPMDASAADAEMCSGTCSALFGACFLSLTNEPLYLAEMLLHEFCHNKLRLLEEFVPLLRPESINKPQYYSPWRDDPRTLEGIQHGLFVFGSIARFWLNVCKDTGAVAQERTLAQRRVATLVHQLKYASAEFSQHAVLTQYGQIFLGEMNDWIAALEEEIEDWDIRAMLPLFSGIVRDKALREIPVADAILRHRSSWKHSYGA